MNPCIIMFISLSVEVIVGLEISAKSCFLMSMGLLGLILRILGLFSNHPRRLLLPYLLRHGLKLPGGPVLLLPDGTVVKVGNPAFLQLEAEATKYARDHTQLPIPRVYDFFTSSDGHKGYLVMQHMPGDMLQRKWRFLSSEQRNSIMAQVRNMIEELRAIPQPEPQGWIGSSSRGAFRDFHIRSNETYGPFPSEAAFNTFRMGCFAKFSYSEEPTTKARLARIGREMPVASDIVFTHGDITRRNLLVDDNAKVVGIIDWEQAGWRPAYWEKVKIHFGGGTGSGWFAGGEFEGYEDDIGREVELHLIHGGGSM